MIKFICFSRQRPLQLAGYLKSLYGNVFGEFEVAVLVRVDTDLTVEYGEVQAAFPDVEWRVETNFKDDLDALIDPAVEYTCFGCDDVVFVRDVWARHIEIVLDKNDFVGLSLRLGRHIKRDMFGGAMGQPEFTVPPLSRFLAWDVTGAESVGDWAYPWEVLGTVYPTPFVLRMISSIDAMSPSQLEARGATIWSGHTDRRLMAAFASARIVVPTVNIVQTEFPGNGIRGEVELSPEFLVECWVRGLRLDVERYRDISPESWRIPHFFMNRDV